MKRQSNISHSTDLTATRQRDQVRALVHAEPTAAIALARAIQDPWFASQALAWVGRFWPYRDYGIILEESVRAGALSDDPYRVASSAAWSIRAFLERGSPVQAEAILQNALQVARTIPYPGSWAEAVFLLFQAAKHSNSLVWVDAFDALANPQNPRLHWRQERNVRYASSMLSSNDVRLLTATGSTERSANVALDWVVEGDQTVSAPRPFFWV